MPSLHHYKLIHAGQLDHRNLIFLYDLPNPLTLPKRNTNSSPLNDITRNIDIFNKLSLTFKNKMSLVMFKTILIRDLQKLLAALQKILPLFHPKFSTSTSL